MSAQQVSGKQTTDRIVRIAMIAAIYAATTLLAMFYLSGLAWGPLQFRVSEAVCVLALFTADAIPGLALGCVVANLVNISLSGSGILGMYDVIFGSLATLLGAWFTYKFREKPALALLGPVVANSIIVPAYLPLILQGIGYYTIPFTEIALDGSYLFMFLFGLISVGVGEAVIMYVVGLPLYHALKKAGLSKYLGTEEK